MKVVTVRNPVWGKEAAAEVTAVTAVTGVTAAEVTAVTAAAGGSSDSNICSNSLSSSENFSLLDGMGNIDSTLVIEEVIQVSVQMYEYMETGMEDTTIQWRKKILIAVLSEDDAVTHFWFRKVHLQK